MTRLERFLFEPPNDSPFKTSQGKYGFLAILILLLCLSAWTSLGSAPNNIDIYFIEPTVLCALALNHFSAYFNLKRRAKVVLRLLTLTLLAVAATALLVELLTSFSPFK